MNTSKGIVETIGGFVPFFGVSIVVGLVLLGAHWLLIRRHSELGNERLFPRQLGMLGLTLSGVFALALAIPVSEGARNQIIAFIGLVVSGIFAFSSSTIFANLLAGIMLRVTKPFRTGDFIRVGEYFGRVVERGLLDTEIQTENRELVALPNTYMITHPIVATRSSGTIVSTTLSLGYDIHHAQVESLLITAANECGLEEPFVQILELGDYSIVYKVSGMLSDVKSLLTIRSSLRRYILDTLHGDQIEIVSPAFMNQRRIPDGEKVMPALSINDVVERVSSAEEVVFDKAEKAEQLDKEKQQLLEKIQEDKLKLDGATKEEADQIRQRIKERTDQLKLKENLDLEIEPQ